MIREVQGSVLVMGPNCAPCAEERAPRPRNGGSTGNEGFNDVIRTEGSVPRPRGHFRRFPRTRGAVGSSAAGEKLV
jgi:hypothetical protein